MARLAISRARGVLGLVQVSRGRTFTAAASLAVLSVALIAGLAWGSHPFTRATVHRSFGQPHRFHVAFKTVSGADEPKTMTVRARGVNARAHQVRGRPRKWVIRQSSAEGRHLIRSLRIDLRKAGAAHLHATGHYGCGAYFRVAFRIDRFNKSADPLFRNATTCS